jgi:hypothetical protein
LQLFVGAERIQYEGYLRRQETNAAITALVRDGVPLKEIVRRTGNSRKLVRQVSRGQSTDIFRTRQNTLDPHLPFLDAQWAEGCRACPHSSRPARSSKGSRSWCATTRHRYRSMDRHRQPEPHRLICAWYHQGQGCGLCSHHRTLVQRPDRRADHEAQAGETPNVRPSENRPPASQASRRHLTQADVIGVASEPKFDPANLIIVNTLGCRSPIGVRTPCRFTGEQRPRLAPEASTTSAQSPSRPP